MSVIEWIALHPDTAILLLLCIALSVIACVQAQGRRQFERRMIREQRALQAALNEAGCTVHEGLFFMVMPSISTFSHSTNCNILGLTPCSGLS